MVEVIGFIISLLALLYLFIKENIPAQRRAHPPSYPQEEELRDDPFNEFLKNIEKEAAAREAAKHLPPPPPKVAKQSKKPSKTPLEEHKLSNQMEQRRLKSSFEDRHVKSKFNHREELPGRSLALSHHREEERSERPSKAQLALRRLGKPRDMIIYQEILDKPKSLRQEAPYR